MPKYMLILYHGTNDICSESIQINGFNDPNDEGRDDHWLGKGIYFFREDCLQAFIWAKNKFESDSKTKEIHVIETEIQIDESNFLNIDSRSGYEYIDEFTKYYYKRQIVNLSATTHP